jgi:hypothetical protein
MGDVEFYLGTKFKGIKDADGNVTCHMSQEGYANMLIDAMGLQDAISLTKITPY